MHLRFGGLIFGRAFFLGGGGAYYRNFTVCPHVSVQEISPAKKNWQPDYRLPALYLGCWQIEVRPHPPPPHPPPPKKNLKKKIVCASKSYVFIYTFRLRLSDPPRQVTLTTSPDPAVVALDQRITLYCRANGYPFPSYYWKQNGNILDVANSWGTLVLTKAKIKDVGSYTCGARNSLGFIESTAVAVNVECKWTSRKDKDNRGHPPYIPILDQSPVYRLIPSNFTPTYLSRSILVSNWAPPYFLPSRHANPSRNIHETCVGNLSSRTNTTWRPMNNLSIEIGHERGRDLTLSSHPLLVCMDIV